MATSPALSLRTIAAQVGRSHTLVQRLITTHDLTGCTPDIQLAAAHLALRRRIPADVVATWATSITTMPTSGWLVFADGALQLIDSPTTVGLLLGNPAVEDITAVRVDTLTYTHAPHAAPNQDAPLEHSDAA